MRSFCCEVMQALRRRGCFWAHSLAHLWLHQHPASGVPTQPRAHGCGGGLVREEQLLPACTRVVCVRCVRVLLAPTFAVPAGKHRRLCWSPCAQGKAQDYDSYCMLGEAFMQIQVCALWACGGPLQAQLLPPPPAACALAGRSLRACCSHTLDEEPARQMYGRDGWAHTLLFCIRLPPRLRRGACATHVAHAQPLLWRGGSRSSAVLRGIHMRGRGI